MNISRPHPAPIWALAAFRHSPPCWHVVVLVLGLVLLDVAWWILLGDRGPGGHQQEDRSPRAAERSSPGSTDRAPGPGSAVARSSCFDVPDKEAAMIMAIVRQDGQAA